jgi:hypothetical protein
VALPAPSILWLNPISSSSDKIEHSMTKAQIRGAVEKEIRTAFRGVGLGAGISLREAQREDRVYADHSASPPTAQGEGITHDWSRVTLEELERDCVAHLDALGFRYYIPALMLSLLDHYDPSSLRVIGTLSGLYPKKDAWRYHMQRYSLLDSHQKAAIAHFLAALPELIELEPTDQKSVERALRNYWSEYLKPESRSQR